MIAKYSDHAANERTFLAWIRTGIAVIAFGFVVEKFNLFLAALASAGGTNTANRVLTRRLGASFGRYDGVALIVIGVSLVAIAGLRFVRTTRLIDDPQPHPVSDGRGEVIFSASLALVIAAASAYLLFG
jgi:inner membrane protein YidH